MNGVFLFLLFKRQTDGLTELEACWMLYFKTKNVEEEALR